MLLQLEIPATMQGSNPCLFTKYINTLLWIIRGRKIVLMVADMRNSAINPKGSVNLPLFIDKLNSIF